MSTGKLARRYNPIRLLGEGAMGQVWLVEDTVTGQEVALKVIAEGSRLSEAAVLQLKQEFRLMAGLRHPHCCAVYDYGLMADGAPYFTMAHVPGRGLDELLPLSEEMFLPVLRQLLLALGYVHQQGLVHRDLKPANVRLQPDGTVQLMDFGLMEYAGGVGGPITGTVDYLAPEVVQRGRIDRRSDLYSLGALAYELLTGRPPFTADKPIEVLRAHVLDRPEPPSRLRPGLDPLWEQVVLKLLAKEPIDRYQSADEVLAALGLGEAEDARALLLTSPMTGREAELGELTRRLALVAAGEPGGAVVVHGPLGLGKSRLIEALRFEVQLSNMPIAVAINHEFAHAPYGPVVAALRGLLPAIKASARDVLDRLAPVLQPLLPELGALPAEELDPPSKEKVRLQGAIAELLGALADRQGLVLAIEDCQWADPLSAELLPAILRHLQHRRALVVLTMREPPAEGSLAELAAPLALARCRRPGSARWSSRCSGPRRSPPPCSTPSPA
ncbi:MAG: serine/threonine-protein kinase [Candidatus Sericytochromatia bacterium]